MSASMVTKQKPMYIYERIVLQNELLEVLITAIAAFCKSREKLLDH